MDLGRWIDFAQWSGKNKGLPFGSYLHSSPPRRQRTLTGPPQLSQASVWHKLQVFSSVETEQHYDSQEQCPLFSKLPLDVRIMIYDLVLGGKAFHIMANKSISHESRDRALSYHCQRPDLMGDGRHHDYGCFGSFERRPSSAPLEDYPEATGLLPLLVTCRRIYSEAIETLYSSNTFEFIENRAAWRFLKEMLPPQRLRCIRRFRWDMRIPHHPNINSRSQRDWADLFTFFTNDTCGLQHLYLRLQTNHPIESIIRQTADEDAAGWIRPIIVMAVDANRKRDCKVQIVTQGIVHEPFSIFSDVARRNNKMSYHDTLDHACTEMHRRIRKSYLAGIH